MDKQVDPYFNRRLLIGVINAIVAVAALKLLLQWEWIAAVIGGVSIAVVIYFVSKSFNQPR